MSPVQVAQHLRAALTHLGSVNNQLTTKRRVAHLERLDRGLVSMAEEEFPEAGDQLFGDQLVDRITWRAETQQALTTVLRRLRGGGGGGGDRKRPSGFQPSSSGANRPRVEYTGPVAAEQPRFFRAAGAAAYGGSSRPHSRPYQAHRTSHSEAD